MESFAVGDRVAFNGRHTRYVLGGQVRRAMETVTDFDTSIGILSKE